MLAESFAAYLKAVYPGQTIEGVQLTEVRRSFYAGAWAVLTSLAPSEAEAAGLKGAVREALQFNEDVKAGIA